MSREETLVDLELKHAINRRKYIENLWTYLSKIKQVCRTFDRSCKVIIFGSFIKGSMRPDSDIDILLVTRLAREPFSRGRLFRAIVEEIGVDNPFEIHIITREEYENVYKKFINAYREV